MSRALTYLWLALLKRQVQYFLRSLRRPTTCIGAVAVLVFVGVGFYYRKQEVFAQLARPASLLGGALVMVCGSLFKGFQQRGLAFEPPDIEFLFTSPFSQRQLILYRLAPNYLFALLQSLVFFGIFASHLKHPVWTSLCLFLFQIACFQVSVGAAIFAGTLEERLHYRIRWMMLGSFGFTCALYLHWGWDLKLVPQVVTSPLVQWFFYPAVSVFDTGTPTELRTWLRSLFENKPAWSQDWPRMFSTLLAFAFGAAFTLWGLLKFKTDLFETALGTTARLAEKRQRIRHGRRESPVAVRGLKSARLPRLALFRGVGAIVWKNLLVARRCRRELALALAFTLVSSGFLAGSIWVLHELMAQGGALGARDMADFFRGLTLLLAGLAFLLQWTFSFDFRRDGRHVVAFRTLPVTPLAIALAEISVPTLFCLAFQALGVLILILVTGLDWSVILVMVLGFPAIALALNEIWNLHYLLSASRRAAGHDQSATTVGTLMVVALSFLIFYPAIRVGYAVGEHAGGTENFRSMLGVAAGSLVQYGINFLLLVILARLFERFEIARD